MAPAPLLAVLEEGRARGFLGPGPVEAHVDHAVALAGLIGAPARRFLDLGSGGGVPGLVLALHWTGAAVTLLDASRRRCDFLREAVEQLELADRVDVAAGRAETLARDRLLRGAFPLVVARAFGAPAVVAECAAAYVSEEGSLAVTEPPDAGAEDSRARWDEAGLARLGLSAPEPRRDGGVGCVVLSRIGPTDERWPRRDGVPGKRPLW